MSMWRTEPRPQQRELTLDALGVPSRSGRRGLPVAVTTESALKHSAVWAALRVRADLMSIFPCDAFRRFEGINVEVVKPQVLINPGGQYWPYIHWMWASQFDLDRIGNAIGLVRARDGLGFPAEIELVPAEKCAVFQYKGMATHRYRVDGKEYTPDQVWHERQYAVPGLPVEEATRLQLPARLAAPQPLRRLRLSPPAEAIATDGPSSVVLDAFCSV